METKTVVTALAALAQETRLGIFRRLVRAGPTGLPAGRISEEMALAPATLSFHLKELTRAGLLSARQEGRFIYYATQFQTMNALVSYLTENCCSDATCATPADCC